MNLSHTDLASKKYFNVFFVVLFFGSILINGCKKDDNNPAESNNPGGVNNAGNSITVNGDGYSSKVFESANNVAMSQYDPSENKTACTFIAPGTEGASVAIYFRAGQAGTYQWNNVDEYNDNANSALVLVIGSGANVKEYISKLNSGSTVVTTYGSVGQSVAGTFSGTLYNVVDDTKTVTVNGKFNTTRQVDAQ